MHPLRFPNSGIRAKALPARVGWPHACYLHSEVAGHGQAPCRGGRPWLGYLQGVAGCGQAPCKGRPPVGAAARKGRPPAGTATASPQGVTAHGQPCHQLGQRLRSQRWPPLGRAVADRKGQRFLKKR
ncbi:hypothetical protein GW17_00058156 [Ensete ventricosum]|nr:hypothetical protein GW17_00058156 [Ensete ventricosum]